jgi:inner membrane protein
MLIIVLYDQGGGNWTGKQLTGPDRVEKGVVQSMFFFGHVGITLGAAVAVQGLVDTGRGVVSRRQQPTQPVPARGISAIAGWTESLSRSLDLRLLVLGSLLPDIIDKPLGIFLFGDGRIFTHSLLVTLLVLVTGFYLFVNYKQKALLAVALGMAGHLILDSMWANPRVFLWPLYGWGFPLGARTSYLSVWLNTLTHVPRVYITEGIGLLVLVLLMAALSTKREFISVLKKGRL